MPALYHPSEKVLVLAASAKLGTERLCHPFNHSTFEQHITGPRLPPIELETRRMFLSLTESSLDQPFGGLLVKEGLHRPQDACSPGFPVEHKHQD
jgi:hypothetical protein